MANPSVDSLLDIAKPDATVDRRLEALAELVEEIATDEHRDRVGDLIKAIKNSPHRTRRNGS